MNATNTVGSVTVAGTAAGRHRSPARAFVSAAIARSQVEILQFFRSSEAVVFTVALPLVLLALLASIFSGLCPRDDRAFQPGLHRRVARRRPRVHELPQPGGVDRH